MKSKYSIYKQYLLLFCIIPTVILLIGLLIGGVNYKILRDNQKLLYEHEAAKISSIVEEAFDYIEGFSRIVGKSIYNENEVSADFIGKLLQKTYSIAQIGKDVTTLTKFDFVLSSGQVIANVTDGELKNPLHVNKNERTWLELAPKHPWKLHISPMVAKGIVGKDQVVDFGVPVGYGITNKNNKFLGIISTGVDVNKLATEVKDNLSLDSIKFAILSDDNQVITNNIYSNTAIVNSLQTIKNIHEGKINFRFGDSNFLFCKKMSRYPFKILVGEDIFTQGNEFQSQVVIPIMYAVSVSILLILLFGLFKNKIIYPVKQLSEIADMISMGKLDVEVPDFKYSEISNLANKIKDIKNFAYEINNAKMQLAENKIKLESLNSNLEIIVKERTLELTKAVAIKDELLNNISHEIRTPIQGVTTISEELVGNWNKFDEQQKFKYISILAKNAKRLFLLVANILDLSRYNKGELVLDIRLMDMAEVINDIIDESKTLYAHGKKIAFEFTSIKDPLINADKERIAQVIRNLLFNAIKFGPVDNVIKIKLSKHKTLQDKSNKYEAIKIEISDLGIGIPEEEINSVFLPFIQSSKTKTGAGGSGLGLAICKSIVDAHKGSISVVNNKETAGVTFSVILPIKHKNNAISLPVKTKHKKIENILAIDDEESVLSTIELMLQNKGYNIIKAVGGSQGLEIIKKDFKKIDLVLLDLMMPDIYGVNLLIELKNDKNTKSIPVIIQSGTADEKEKQRCIQLGAASFLSKPYSKADLLEKIKNIY